MGDDAKANRYKVKLEYNKMKWKGPAVSLENGLTDIVKSAKFICVDSNATNLLVEIK